MKTLNTLLAAGIVLVLLAAGGCAELKKNLPDPVSPSPRVHGGGWIDTASSNFHGRAIRSADWKMDLCQSCHGLNYAGGFVEVSCRTCHNKPAGPENCTTCHGGVNPAPPRDLSGNTARTARGVGAHQIHLLGSALTAGIPCSECHKVPPTMYEAGHVDSPSPAEVMFTRELASLSTNRLGTQFYSSLLPLVTPAPVYDANQLTCSNTYCHGAFKNGNPDVVVVWNDVSGTQAACGTCHGNPNAPDPARRPLPKTDAEGGSHPNVTACSACHADVVDSAQRIINKTKHINGKLNVFGIEIDF